MNDPSALATLLETVGTQPWAHDYFALLRRIDALSGMPRLGKALRPRHEPLRVGQDVELDFASATLTSVAFDRSTAPRLGVRFFGLFGPHGPMPLHLTEWVRERRHTVGDDTPSRFFDLFHHRLLLLFYRAWADAQPAVQHDRPAEDRHAAWRGSLIGLEEAAPVADDPRPPRLPAAAQLCRTGLLATRTYHPEGLGHLLARFFHVPVRIVEHAAHRLVLAPDDRTRLGRHSAPSSTSGWQLPRLGENAVAGHLRHDRQFHFRIVLGPLSMDQYLAFLPGTPQLALLTDWVKRYVGLHLTWDLCLCLQGSDVPAARLDGRMSLARTAWLHAPERASRARDRDDLRLSSQRPLTATPSPAHQETP